MKKTLFVALLALMVSINTTAQIVTTATARQYLPTAQAFSFQQFGNSEQLAHPNPASDVIRFNGRIVVQDLYGRVLLQGDNEIDVHHLADGLYIVNGKKHIIKH